MLVLEGVWAQRPRQAVRRRSRPKTARAALPLRDPSADRSGPARAPFQRPARALLQAHWQERPALVRTESPRYLGRAVVALAADADVLSKSGRVPRVADLASEYEFNDIDGRQVGPFEVDAT